MGHQNLAVDTSAGSDAYYGNSKLRCYSCGELCRNLFEYQCETADFFKEVCVGDQLFGFLLAAGTHCIGAEFIDGLWGESQMSHYGNACAKDAFDAFADFGAAFDLYGFGMAFLHYADGGSESFLGVALVGAERHVAYHKRALCTFYHAFGVVDHLVEGYRESGDIAGHDVGGRVTYKYYINTCLIHEAGHGVVVGGEHGDLLAALFHLDKSPGGNFSQIVRGVC